MRLELTSDAESFAALAADFLAATPERNLLATVLNDVLTRSSSGGEPLFACGLDERDEPVAVALRTPPWPLLAHGFDCAEDARALLAEWLALDPRPGAVGAEPATARTLAGAWEDLAGGTSQLLRKEAMHALDAVRAPARPAPGRLRVASPAERPLLIAWEEAFGEEANVASRPQAARNIDARMAAGRLFVWDDGGAVSYLARSGPVAGVTRIGPVYTPPEQRRRGYATSAVASLAQRSLDEGSSRCMLFTDLANPTSNRIYAAIGFVRFGDWEDIALRPRAAAAAPRP